METITLINKNFLIRIRRKDFNGLIGVGQYEKLVGKKIKINHFKKVLEGKKDKYTFLIRNRLKIEFISK